MFTHHATGEKALHKQLLTFHRVSQASTLVVSSTGLLVWNFHLFSCLRLPSLCKDAGAVEALGSSPQVVSVVQQALLPAEVFLLSTL